MTQLALQVEQETIEHTEIASLVIAKELTVIVSESKPEMATQAQSYALAFSPFMDKVHELSKALAIMDKENPSEMDVKIARINRLALVKNRGLSDDKKDELKSDLLVRGKLIDNLNGVIKNSSALTESEYASIEKFAENREKERKEKLRNERLELLKDVCDNSSIYPLGEMEQASFDDLLNGFKLAKEAKLEREKKEEAERIESVRLDKLENIRRLEVAPFVQFLSAENSSLREMSDEDYTLLLKNLNDSKVAYDKEQEEIKAENAKLKREKEERDIAIAQQEEKTNSLTQRGFSFDGKSFSYRELIISADSALKSTHNEFITILKDADVKILAIKKREQDEADALTEKQRKADVDLAASQKKQKELQAQIDENNRLAAKKAQEEKDAKALEEQNAIKAKRAPDREKLIAFAKTIDDLILPEMTSEDGIAMAKEFQEKKTGFVNWIISKTNVL